MKEQLLKQMKEQLAIEISQSLAEDCLYVLEGFIKTELPTSIHTWLAEYEPNFKVPVSNSKQVLFSYVERCHAFVSSKIEESFQKKSFYIEQNILIPRMAYWIKSSFNEFCGMSEDDIVAQIKDLKIDIPVNYINPHQYRIDGVAPIPCYGWISSVISSYYVMIKGSKKVLERVKEMMGNAYVSYFQASDLPIRFKDEIYKSVLKVLCTIVQI